jgi:hypothetical protein
LLHGFLPGVVVLLLKSRSAPIREGLLPLRADAADFDPQVDANAIVEVSEFGPEVFAA